MFQDFQSFSHRHPKETCKRNQAASAEGTDGSLLCLSPKQVADLLGHSTSEITEMYYVKRDNTRLVGITDGFAL